MKRENLHSDISNSLASLLKLARQLSYNKISDHCLFILSEIKNSEESFHIQNQKRIKENNFKAPKTYEEIIIELEKIFKGIYDINLYIFKSLKNVTIIDIRYYSRNSIDLAYQKQTESKETMIHCKVNVPPYLIDKNEKFDINWEHKTLKLYWKLFWTKRKIKKRLRL